MLDTLSHRSALSSLLVAHVARVHGATDDLPEPPTLPETAALRERYFQLFSWEEIATGVGGWISDDGWDLLRRCWRWVLRPKLDSHVRAQCRGLLLVAYGGVVQPGLKLAECEKWALLTAPDHAFVHDHKMHWERFDDRFIGTLSWPPLLKSTGGVFLDVGASSYANFTAKHLLPWRPGHLHLFEPLPWHYVHLRARWARKYRNVTFHNYGLGRETKFDVPFVRLGGSTSTWHQLFFSGASGGRMYLESTEGARAHRKNNALETQVNEREAREGAIVRSAAETWQHLGIDRAALLSLNCEGCEYDVLPALKDAGLLGRVDRILLQAHLVLNEVEVADALEYGKCSSEDGSCEQVAAFPAIHRYCDLLTNVLGETHRRVYGLPLSMFALFELRDA